MIILDGTPTITTAGNQQVTLGSKQQPNINKSNLISTKNQNNISKQHPNSIYIQQPNITKQQQHINKRKPCEDCSVLHRQPVSVALPHVGHHVLRALVEADEDHLNRFALTN